MSDRRSPLALPRHGPVEPLDGHLATLPTQHVLSQIEREAVGVVKPESNFSGQGLASTEPSRLFLEQAKTALKCLLEVCLLEPQRLGDQGLGAQ